MSESKPMSMKTTRRRTLLLIVGIGIVASIVFGSLSARAFLTKLFRYRADGESAAIQSMSLTDHHEDWAAYLSTIDNNKVGSILVDLGLKTIAPVRDKLNRLRIDVKMQSPNSDGLPLPQEFDSLNEIEEKINQRLKNESGAIPAGHLYCAGAMSLYEYIDDNAQLDRQISETMAGFPGYVYEYRIDREENWRSYNDLLYPLPIQMQSIFNQKVVASLESQGDKLTVKRPVDHMIYFKNESDIEHFLAEIKGKGFVVKQKEKIEAAEYSWTLLIERNDPVDLKSVNEYVLHLWQRAQDANGDYDGWGSSLVKQ